jgi:integrase
LFPVSVKKFDGSKQLCRRDIDINNSFIIVSFKWTKTIQVGNRVLRLPLTAISNSKFCPVQAYTGMCELNPFCADSPAFAALHKKDVVHITYRQEQLKLKSLIAQVGLNPKLFSSHSFRRGGASLAARSGVAPHLIQLLADWESEAYKQYVVHSLTEKYKVAR